MNWIGGFWNCLSNVITLKTTRDYIYNDTERTGSLLHDLSINICIIPAMREAEMEGLCFKANLDKN
jgi:hypothetical protein